MELLNSTGATSYVGTKVTAPIQALAFVITAGVSVNNLKAIQLEVNQNGAKGSAQKIYPMSLYDAMQLKTGGAFRLDSTNFSLSGIVELNREGSVNLDNDSFYTVNLTSTIAGMTVKMYGLESKSISDRNRVITVDNLTSTSETSLGNVKDCVGLGFDYTKVTQIRLQYNNGRQIIYLQNELKALADLYNEFVAIDSNAGAFGTVKSGYDTILYLPIADCTTAWITPSASVNVYQDWDLNR